MTIYQNDLHHDYDILGNVRQLTFILKLARTIAELAGSENSQSAHLAEAL
jgi:predicted ATPase with chaperone activity